LDAVKTTLVLPCPFCATLALEQLNERSRDVTIKSFFKTAGTVSLKALRGLWGFVGALVAACAYILGEAFKHASAADDDSGEYQEYGHESAESYHRAAANHYKDW